MYVGNIEAVAFPEDHGAVNLLYDFFNIKIKW